ncbi:hypothetical protein CQA81_31680, partial [Klebsiella pneumoniae]
ATYLYKLTNKLGTPSYHLMAAVAVVLICITIPAGDAPAAADATYLYKLTNKLGTPSYHLMAAVAVVLICITIPA